MAKFIVEVTTAYAVEASDEETAMEVLNDMDPGEREASHEAAGFFQEVTAVYEADELDVDDDLHAMEDNDNG